VGTEAQVFYLNRGDDLAWDGTTPGGGDIRGLRQTAPAAMDGGVCSFTTAIANITVDPFTTRSTTGTAQQDIFGWAFYHVDPGIGYSGMDSTATAKRIIPAGTWSFAGTLAAPVLATTTYGVQCSVYRLSTADARTLLFQVSAGANVTPTVAGAAWSAASSQPQFTLEDNESLLVTFQLYKTGTTLIAESITFRVTSAAQITVPSPGVRTLSLTSTFAASGVGVASTQRQTILLPKVAIGFGVAAFTRKITAARAFAATGVGVASTQRKTIPGTYIATGVGVATTQRKTILQAKLATGVGVATTQRKIILQAKVAIGVGVAGFTRFLLAFRAFSAVGVGVAGFARRVTAVRAFAVQAIGAPFMKVEMPQTALNRIVGGGTTIVNVHVGVFDDL
jgi:hypothetical protein